MTAYLVGIDMLELCLTNGPDTLLALQHYLLSSTANISKAPEYPTLYAFTLCAAT